MLTWSLDNRKLDKFFVCYMIGIGRNWRLSLAYYPPERCAFEKATQFSHSGRDKNTKGGQPPSVFESLGAHEERGHELCDLKLDRVVVRIVQVPEREACDDDERRFSDCRCDQAVEA